MSRCLASHLACCISTRCTHERIKQSNANGRPSRKSIEGAVVRRGTTGSCPPFLSLWWGMYGICFNIFPSMLPKERRLTIDSFYLYLYLLLPYEFLSVLGSRIGKSQRGGLCERPVSPLNPHFYKLFYYNPFFSPIKNSAAAQLVSRP